jgi:hypothetical protein
VLLADVVGQGVERVLPEDAVMGDPVLGCAHRGYIERAPVDPTVDRAPDQARASPHIHQEQTFAASPDDIFTALTQSTAFSAMTGAPAQIDPAAGGEFPDGTGEHLDAGWHPHYREPLTRRFA